jgi:hypothetical protein
LRRFERARVRLQIGSRTGHERREEFASYTARRLRPFARRRASTARPDRVAMRARNPWVRLRCKLLGW